VTPAPDDTTELGSTGAEATPGWFRRALAIPCTDLWFEVGGCRLHALAWGEPGRRGLVFVHGGGAHAHWWTHVAALFADAFRVVAVDLSGHGDSGTRSAYSLEQWTDEVIAAAAAGEIDGPAVVVGHSMGGFVTIATAALHPEHLAGVVVCDSPVTRPDPEIDAARVGDAFGRPKVYPTRDEALARFRTVPAQEHYLDYVLCHVAEHSLRQVPGGWSWKFDHTVFSTFTANPRAIARPYLAQVRSRFALLRSECGLVTADIGDYMYEVLGRAAPVIELPEAGHHAMLDQPLLLLTALRTLLADWDHSVPRRR
jgi:pimeloyl-ACP methyl ester carboxylesterase